MDGTTTYLYDALGRRVQKTTSGTTHYFGFDLAGRVFAEYNSTAIRFETFVGGRHLATYSAGLLFLMSRILVGSERVKMTQDGVNAESSANLPFGDDQLGWGNAFGLAGASHFTGKDRDIESNLDHFWFRQYSSTQGRWMTPDPFRQRRSQSRIFQTWNRYAYVANNPLSWVDSLGLAKTLTLAGGGQHPDKGSNIPDKQFRALPACADAGCLDENGLDSLERASLGMVASPSETVWASMFAGTPDSGSGNSTSGNPCGTCVYLNNSGTAPDTNGIDANSNQDECKKNGGLFVDQSQGAVGQVTVDPDTNTIISIIPPVKVEASERNAYPAMGGNAAVYFAQQAAQPGPSGYFDCVGKRIGVGAAGGALAGFIVSSIFGGEGAIPGGVAGGVTGGVDGLADCGEGH